MKKEIFLDQHTYQQVVIEVLINVLAEQRATLNMMIKMFGNNREEKLQFFDQHDKDSAGFKKELVSKIFSMYDQIDLSRDSNEIETDSTLPTSGIEKIIADALNKKHS